MPATRDSRNTPQPASQSATAQCAGTTAEWLVSTRTCVRGGAPTGTSPKPTVARVPAATSEGGGAAAVVGRRVRLLLPPPLPPGSGAAAPESAPPPTAAGEAAPRVLRAIVTHGPPGTAMVVTWSTLPPGTDSAKCASSGVRRGVHSGACGWNEKVKAVDAPGGSHAVSGNTLKGGGGGDPSTLPPPPVVPASPSSSAEPAHKRCADTVAPTGPRLATVTTRRRDRRCAELSLVPLMAGPVTVSAPQSTSTSPHCSSSGPLALPGGGPGVVAPSSSPPPPPPPSLPL